MKPIEYQLPKHKQPVYGILKRILKFFMPKTKVVALGGKATERCLYIANHANKTGPFLHDLYLPVYSVKWGAHEMLEDYAARRAYLRDVLYIQKNKTGKRRAAFKAFFEAFFSKYFYRGIKVLPTYHDARLWHTVKKSVEVLSDDTALMIFPENSNDGYFDMLTEFVPGFVSVMSLYRKKKGEDIPVRPVYFHKKKRIMLIGEPSYLEEYLAQGMDRREIAEAFRNKVNDLYTRIESGEFDDVKDGASLPSVSPVKNSAAEQESIVS